MKLQQLLNQIYDYIDANIEQYNQIVSSNTYVTTFHLPTAKVELYREELHLHIDSKTYEIGISTSIFNIVKEQVFLLKQEYENQKIEKLHNKVLDKLSNALKAL